ncbi:MFS transporter [Streptacidiphilus rugosus]|uniref:MFS transporter n=1 Tax=Streptacidiphilus rugosus TaxID=405783 RepID=UPI00068EA86C|nr:MFS transporter [Streptacidiphilus rugosus]
MAGLSALRGGIERQLINRDYARLWYGQAVSTLGDFVFDTTLVLWVATDLARGRSWAPAAVSGVMLAVGTAVLVVGPLAGVFVDRWDRKRVLLRTEVVRALLTGSLAAVSFLPASALPTGVWLALIYAVVFGVNAAGQFFSPARFAVLGQVVSGDADRTRAAGIGQATTASASIIGPPLAAPLLFAAGLQWALVLNALSYVFSWWAIRSVRVAEQQHDGQSAAGAGRLRQEFVAGLRFFVGNRFLVALLGIAVIAQCGTGAINSLNIFFVTGNLHTDSRLYGFVSTAFGVGAIAGSLLAGRVVRRLGARTTTWAALLLTGALVLAYARQTGFVGGVVLLTAFSLPVAMLNTAMTPLLLDATPTEYLGRMMAVFNPVNQLASMLSVVVAGWLASSALRDFHGHLAGVGIGPIDTVFSAAGLCIVMAGLYAAISLPRKREPEPAAAPAPQPAAAH